MEAINEFINPALLCGIVFLIAGIVTKRFPPKQINYLYGYRTARSMRSLEEWNYAQKYSAIKMIQIATFLILISIIANIVLSDLKEFNVASFFIVIISIMYLFVKTEKALKNKFIN